MSLTCATPRATSSGPIRTTALAPWLLAACEQCGHTCSILEKMHIYKHTQQLRMATMHEPASVSEANAPQTQSGPGHRRPAGPVRTRRESDNTPPPTTARSALAPQGTFAARRHATSTRVPAAASVATGTTCAAHANADGSARRRKLARGRARMCARSRAAGTQQRTTTNGASAAGCAAPPAAAAASATRRSTPVAHPTPARSVPPIAATSPSYRPPASTVPSWPPLAPRATNSNAVCE
jgi:hypothetical protein